ncbi:hypothetical protein BDR04DRAFT_1158170 [Suillus decipiens]|nr:hypothetical protein BDR04DRAFT_1158170 [Suillus decipiens]
MADHEDVQLPATENKQQEDGNIEDGEIIDMGDVDINVNNDAGGVDDDIVMEMSNQLLHMQQVPVSCCSSSSTPSFIHDSTSMSSYASLPCLHPPVTPISMHYSDQNVVSLNSLKPLHDKQSNGQYPFFSDFNKPVFNANVTPNDSDSDVGASNAMKGLRVDLHRSIPA